MTFGPPKDPDWIPHESHEMRMYTFDPLNTCYWCELTVQHKHIVEPCKSPANPMLTREEKRARPFICNAAEKLPHDCSIDAAYKCVVNHHEYAELHKLPMTVVFAAKQWHQMQCNATKWVERDLFGRRPCEDGKSEWTFAGCKVEIAEDRARRRT